MGYVTIIMGVCMESIYNLNREDLENYLVSNGEKKYRTLQIIDWLYVKRVKDFKSMSNLSLGLIEKLERDFNFDDIHISIRQSGEDVDKFLITLSDNHAIEAVLMHHDYGSSLCISTEIGCNMGCHFCESGRLKKICNLTPSEMVMQILLIEEAMNIRISHVVLMGIGEPFDNYDNVCKFVSIVNDCKGINLGSRHITISTCGIVPKIYEFSDFPYQVNLAISLHAPNDKIRSQIMNINKAYPLSKVMEAIKYYIKKTNRRVTFEYIMLSQVNDSLECAKELSELLKGINCYVNLIPYNETNNISFKRSNMEQIMKFYDILKKNKINVTIRREFGGNIDAACGQLRAKGEVV